MNQPENGNKGITMGNLPQTMGAAQYFDKGMQGAYNTQRAYASDLAQFTLYCNNYGLVHSPATPESLANYLAYLANKGYKMATITRKLASISKWHLANGFSSPARHPQINIVVEGIKRTIGEGQAQAKAFGVVKIASAIEGIEDSMKGIRDKALLLIGFTGAFRRSELAALTIDDLDFRDDCLVIRIKRSKTNQYGQDEYKALYYASNPKLCPIRNLKKYLAVLDKTEGYLLVSCKKGGKWGEQLTDRAIDQIIKNRLGNDFSGHSLRASFVTVAKINGASDSEIMRQTGHKTVAMIRRYTRINDITQHNAAMKLGI